MDAEFATVSESSSDGVRLVMKVNDEIFEAFTAVQVFAHENGYSGTVD